MAYSENIKKQVLTFLCCYLYCIFSLFERPLMALSFLVSFLFVTIFLHGVDRESRFPFYKINIDKVEPIKAQYNSLTASKLFSNYPPPEFIFLFIYLFLFFILHTFLCNIITLPRLKPKCNFTLKSSLIIQLFLSLPK